jgi:hypothetical protein
MPVIRPSWPPPSIPIVAPGSIISLRKRLAEHVVSTLLTPCAKAIANLPMLDCDYLGREDCGVRRAWLANRERADRDARRHLNDGEQRINAVQDRRCDRDA